MAFSIDDNGNIELIQGDSGQLTITGLDTERIIPFILRYRMKTEIR